MTCLYIAIVVRAVSAKGAWYTMLPCVSAALLELNGKGYELVPSEFSFAHQQFAGWILRVVTQPVFCTLEGSTTTTDEIGDTSIFVEDYEFDTDAASWSPSLESALLVRENLRKVNVSVIEVNLFMRVKTQHVMLASGTFVECPSLHFIYTHVACQEVR